MQRRGWIAGLQRVRADQQDWRARVAALLPQELQGALVGVVHKGEQLTVLTASAAWCSRVRYALAALEPQLLAGRPDIVKVLVRVAPAGRAP